MSTKVDDACPRSMTKTILTDVDKEGILSRRVHDGHIRGTMSVLEEGL